MGFAGGSHAPTCLAIGLAAYDPQSWLIPRGCASVCMQRPLALPERILQCIMFGGLSSSTQAQDAYSVMPEDSLAEVLGDHVVSRSDPHPPQKKRSDPESWVQRLHLNSFSPLPSLTRTIFGDFERITLSSFQD